MKKKSEEKKVEKKERKAKQWIKPEKGDDEDATDARG
jgi:hypothetical protein